MNSTKAISISCLPQLQHHVRLLARLRSTRTLITKSTAPMLTLTGAPISNTDGVLHSHTTGTDGALEETVEKHYDHNFDILAVTDHGTTDYGWDDPSTNRLLRLQ